MRTNLMKGIGLAIVIAATSWQPQALAESKGAQPPSAAAPQAPGSLEVLKDLGITCNDPGGAQPLAKKPIIKNQTGKTLPAGSIVQWTATDGDTSNLTLTSDVPHGGVLERAYGKEIKAGTPYKCIAKLLSWPHPSVPGTPRADLQITIKQDGHQPQFVVTNGGAVDAPATKLHIYCGNEGGPAYFNGSGCRLGSSFSHLWFAEVPILKPGESKTFVLFSEPGLMTMPVAQTSSPPLNAIHGTYTYFAQVDANAEVIESDEKNNFSPIYRTTCGTATPSTGCGPLSVAGTLN